MPPTMSCVRNDGELPVLGAATASALAMVVTMVMCSFNIDGDNVDDDDEIVDDKQL